MNFGIEIDGTLETVICNKEWKGRAKISTVKKNVVHVKIHVKISAKMSLMPYYFLTVIIIYVHNIYYADITLRRVWESFSYGDIGDQSSIFFQTFL